ncbi:hypothetical protein ACWD4T_51745 [Streptomyces umbrinus]
MNDAADEPAAVKGDEPGSTEPVPAEDDGLAPLLSELHEVAQGLPQAAQEKLQLLLDPEKISYAKGIEPDRVSALFGGAVPDGDDSKEAAQARIIQRLLFLRKTRLKTPMTRRLSGRTPRPYTLGEIARGAKISKQIVHYVFTEGRLTSPENVASLERHFGVLPGFCSHTEIEALKAYLEPIVQNLKFLTKVAEAYGHGVTKVAARSADDLSQDPDAMDEILTAVIAARKKRR